jgi:hypothetical protein
MKVPLAGGTPTTLYSGPGQAILLAIAIDETSVYWTDYSIGTVMRVPLGGGTATTLASGQSNPLPIAVNATGVYWGNLSTPGTVMRLGTCEGSVCK